MLVTFRGVLVSCVRSFASMDLVDEEIDTPLGTAHAKIAAALDADDYDAKEVSVRLTEDELEEVMADLDSQADRDGWSGDDRRHVAAIRRAIRSLEREIAAAK